MPRVEAIAWRLSTLYGSQTRWRLPSVTNRILPGLHVGDQGLRFDVLEV
jgi:hypothetical protein